jgi:predicted RNase H-like nuclease
LGAEEGGHTEDVKRVIGVDACKKGWVGVTSDLRGYFGRTIDELVALATPDGHLELVAIDIPIGLPTSGPRQADLLARAVVGKRASSVFSTPIRAALTAATHAEATAMSVKATGKGVSQQAYALAAKILEVDAWAKSARHRCVEVHPEVSFATMAGHPLNHSKVTWAGSEERRRLLADVGIVLPSELGLAGRMAGADDVLDAAAACWTAMRCIDGRAVAHPPEPETFGDGHTAAIWA